MKNWICMSDTDGTVLKLSDATQDELNAIDWLPMNSAIKSPDGVIMLMGNAFVRKGDKLYDRNCPATRLKYLGGLYCRRMMNAANKLGMLSDPAMSELDLAISEASRLQTRIEKVNALIDAAEDCEIVLTAEQHKQLQIFREGMKPEVEAIVKSARTAAKKTKKTKKQVSIPPGR